MIPGDCNDTIGAGLTWLSQQGTAASGPHLGQALAYLDPDNHTQLGWNTIETLAKFSRRRSSTNAYIRTRPIELLILFPTGTMRRCLPVRDGSEPAARSDVRAIDRLFGSEAWKAIYEDQRQGILTGDNGWRLYVDLFRDQLEDLGYRYVSAIETRNTKNGMLYHMVSASGSDVGAKIMRSVLNRASELFPQKIEEAKKLRGAPGTQPLFDPNEEDIAFAPDRYAAMLLKPPVRHELGMIETVEVTTPRLARRSGSSDDGQLSMDV